MNKIIIHLFVIIILLIPFSVYSSNESCLKDGDYISEAFINKIQNGLSLERSSYGLEFIFASVLQRENDVGIALSTFHDSVILCILPDCHTIKDIEKYPSKYVFERINKDTFKINTEKQDHIFKYVGNDSFDWIAIQIFSGKWSDESGNNFVFNKNGKVNINSKIANYTIGRPIHSGEIGIIVDIVKIGQSNYVFKISNNKLSLYEALEGTISKEPKYILKLIKKFH